MGTKPRTGRVAFSLNLALFNLISASVVFLYSPSPCSLRKCSFSFACARLEFLNLALQIMQLGRRLPSRSVIHANPYCTYSSDHFLFFDRHSMKGLKYKKERNHTTYHHNSNKSTTEHVITIHMSHLCVLISAETLRLTHRAPGVQSNPG